VRLTRRKRLAFYAQAVQILVAEEAVNHTL
jgi:hypothetical protein